MDTEDTNKSAKAVKAAKTVSSQDQASTSNTMAQPEWHPSYFNAGKASLPPGYYPSPIASSPPGHPYPWGPQHMMAPYGTTPTPYMPVYSPGAMYTHPSITAGAYPYSSFGLSSGAVDETNTGALPVGTEVLAKYSEPKDQIPSKNSKAGLGSLNVLTRKASESTKGMTTNGVFSQSAESGSDESSDRSNEDSAHGSQAEKKLPMDQVSTEVNNSQNDSRISPYTSSQSMQMQGMIGSQTVAMNSNPGVPMMALSLPTTSGIISGPMTNLNIGMDVWGGTSITPSAMRGGLSSPNAVIPQNMSAAAGSHEPPVLDEREIKRQKRKLSNRESARRSRQRKQAECEELQKQVGVLKDENDSLRAELAKMRSQCEKLSSENASLMQKVQSLCGNECRDFRNNADQQNIESQN